MLIWQVLNPLIYLPGPIEISNNYHKKDSKMKSKQEKTWACFSSLNSTIVKAIMKICDLSKIHFTSATWSIQGHLLVGYFDKSSVFTSKIHLECWTLRNSLNTVFFVLCSINPEGNKSYPCVSFLRCNYYIHEDNALIT